MAIEQEVHPYEILIRMGPNGYQAAHVVDIEQLVDRETGEVKMARELPARPIAVENAGHILGEANAALLTQLDAAIQEAADAVQQKQTAETRAALALNRALEAEAVVTSLQAALAKAQSQLKEEAGAESSA